MAQDGKKEARAGLRVGRQPRQSTTHALRQGRFKLQLMENDLNEHTPPAARDDPTVDTELQRNPVFQERRPVNRHLREQSSVGGLLGPKQEGLGAYEYGLARSGTDQVCVAKDSVP